MGPVLTGPFLTRRAMSCCLSPYVFSLPGLGQPNILKFYIRFSCHFCASRATLLCNHCVRNSSLIVVFGLGQTSDCHRLAQPSTSLCEWHQMNPHGTNISCKSWLCTAHLNMREEVPSSGSRTTYLDTGEVVRLDLTRGYTFSL